MELALFLTPISIPTLKCKLNLVCYTILVFKKTKVVKMQNIEFCLGGQPNHLSVVLDRFRVISHQVGITNNFRLDERWVASTSRLCVFRHTLGDYISCRLNSQPEVSGFLLCRKLHFTSGYHNPNINLVSHVLLTLSTEIQW